jgi:hypothetical protein
MLTLNFLPNVFIFIIVCFGCVIKHYTSTTYSAREEGVELRE